MKILGKDLLNLKFKKELDTYWNKKDAKINFNKQFWSMIELYKELIEFFRERKKWWLVPIVLFLLLFGSIIVVSQGSSVAPFIYAIFWGFF